MAVLHRRDLHCPAYAAAGARRLDDRLAGEAWAKPAPPAAP